MGSLRLHAWIRVDRELSHDPYPLYGIHSLSLEQVQIFTLR